jgi:hypothetical protein
MFVLGFPDGFRLLFKKALCRVARPHAKTKVAQEAR